MTDATKTIYKHKDWYKEGNKTVFEAIKYMQDSGDFYLDILPKYKKTGFKGYKTVSEVLCHFINNKMYKDIIIRYKGREGGSDKGALKIATWIKLAE
jgi:hypothetical protein